METLNRNKKTFYYAQLEGTEELKDDEGYYTGESVQAYSEPKECKGYITSAKGEVDIEMFGPNIQYDRTIILSGDTQINENSHLWITNSPNEPHDYIVTRVAKSLNFSRIAIQKVNKQ